MLLKQADRRAVSSSTCGTGATCGRCKRRPDPVRAGRSSTWRSTPVTPCRTVASWRSAPRNVAVRARRRLCRRARDAGGGLCADRDRRIPARASRRRSSTRSSSRSSPPKRSARAPGSACRWCMASSSSPAGSLCLRQRGGARHRRSASICRAISARRRRTRLRGAGEDRTAKRQARAPTSPVTGTVLLVEDEEAVRAFGARAPGPARLHRAGSVVRRRGAGGDGRARRRGGPDRLRRGDAGDGRADAASANCASAAPRPEIIFVSGYAEEAFSQATCRKGRSSPSCPSPSR